MELVIKIPDHYYENNIKKELPIILSEDNIKAILPKGHGELIDANAMIKHVANLPKYPNGHSKVYDEAMIINIISNESTIIEADKGANK